MKPALLTITATLSLFAAATLHAVPITGEIQFSAPVTLNAPLGSATEVTGYVSPVVVTAGSQLGTYAAIPNATTAAWNPFSFTASSGSLWSLTANLINYSFEIDSLSIFSQAPGLVLLVGSGTAYADNFDATSASVRILLLSGQDNTTMTATFTAVPDGGTTLILLGAGLSSLAILRRKFFANS